MTYSSTDAATKTIELTGPVGMDFAANQTEVSLDPQWENSSEIGAANTAPLLNLFPDTGTYQGTASAVVYLPGDQTITSGEVVMFVGPHHGIAANSSSELPAPSLRTNPTDTFGLFEWSLTAGSSPDVDYDVSAIDQVGFPFPVSAQFSSSQDPPGPPSPAPYNQGVGFIQNRDTLFNRYTPYITSASTNTSASVFLDLAPARGRR